MCAFIWLQFLFLLVWCLGFVVLGFPLFFWKTTLTWVDKRGKRIWKDLEGRKNMIKMYSNLKIALNNKVHKNNKLWTLKKTSLAKGAGIQSNTSNYRNYVSIRLLCSVQQFRVHVLLVLLLLWLNENRKLRLREHGLLQATLTRQVLQVLTTWFLQKWMSDFLFKFSDSNCSFT